MNAEKRVQLDELLVRAKELKTELDVVNSLIHILQQDEGQEMHGVSVGSIVIRAGIEYIVEVVEPRQGGKPWVKGRLLLNYGGSGKIVHQLYSDWDFPN